MNHRFGSLLVCLLVSLAAHLAIIVPTLARVFEAGAQPDDAEETFEPQPLLQPPPEEQRLSLGVEAGAPSTMTWVGYEEYERHMAALAEVEQAAFTDQPVVAAPVEQQPLEPSVIEQAPPEEPKAAEPLPRLGLTSQDLIPLHALLEMAGSFSQQPEPRPQAQPDPQPHLAASAPPAEQTPPQQPVAQQPQTGEPEVGAQADKQSAPSSIIDIPPDQWRLGKPLAAEGLELKPRKADFTLLTLLTAHPANPLVEIVFDQQGVPTRASIVRSTGDKRVDDAILASLYRWRAAGSRLSDVRDGETFAIQLQLLLSRRR